MTSLSTAVPSTTPFSSSSSSALPLSTSSSSVQSSSSSSSASSSFVAPEAYVVITSSSLQPWCSAYLGYTVPIATVTELYTNTQSTVQTSVSTEIDYSTSISTSTEVDVSTFTASVTITTGVPTGGSQSKRDDLMRPSALMPYPESAILSGCNKAVTSPATSTLYASTTATTVQTSIFSTATTTISTVISSTVTTQVTSKTLTMTSTVLTSAIPVQTQFVSNPSFEIGNGPSNLTSWTSYGSGADLSTTAANAYDGNQAFVFKAVHTYLTQAFSALIAGQTYTIVYHYKAVNPAPSVALSSCVFSMSMSGSMYGIENDITISQEIGWTTVSVNYTSNAAAGSIDIYLASCSGSGSTPYVYLDEVTLTTV
ncbi:hypothetical protein MBLNU459_g7561t1 [Dothideomycetes sp. NU459]